MSYARILMSLLAALLSAVAVAAKPVSGYEYLTAEMQDDNFGNPGLLAVEEGGRLFSQPGANGKSCAACHGEGGEQLEPGRLARYPVYSETALQLEAFVRHLAHGQTFEVDISGPMATY